MAFTQDELKDGDTIGEREEEKDGGAKHLDENGDKGKAKDGQMTEVDGVIKEDRSGVIEEGDGGCRQRNMMKESHATCYLIMKTWS